MHSAISNAIKWSMLELRGLVEDEDTRVYFQTANRHLGLHPFHLNDLNRALREILNSTVNFYDNELQGLVLAYKNPKLLSPLGAILHDSYFIHVDISADFYIFKPEIGCTLKGIINKKAANHVGVLVHKAFNVSIQKTDESEEWLGDCVYVGEQVKFTVTHMDFKGKLPFIRGELLPDGITVQNREDAVSSINGDELDKKFGQWKDSEAMKLSAESSKKRSKKSIVIDSSGDELTDSDNKLKVFREKEAKSTTLSSESPKKRSKKSNGVDSSGEELTDSDNKLKVFREKTANSTTRNSELPQKRSKKSNVVEPNGDELSDSDNKLKVFREKKAIDSKSPKERSKKSGVIDSSGDEVSDSDNKSKVFRRKEEKSSRVKKRVSADNRHDDESHTDESEEQVPKSCKTEEHEESRNKRDRKKRRDSSYKKSDSEDIDERPKLSSRKDSNQSGTNGVSYTMGDESVLKTEPQGPSRKRPHKNTTPDASPKKKCSAENEIGVIESLKVEKTSKDKKTETASKSNNSSNGVQHDSNDDPDDNVVAPKKRSKKNRTCAAEDSDESEIDTKPVIIVKKKKTKTYTVEDESEMSGVDEKTKVLPSCDSNFEFIKPDLDAFAISSAKCKRKRRKNTDGNSEEASKSSKSDLAQNIEGDNDFFQDIRIKAEPDPSDVEDAASKEKSVKRKKKHAKTEVESGDESRFGITKIKTEPNMSDVEDAMPSKKKSKRRRNSERELLDDVKIKVEPNASDVEGSVTSKQKFKSEPHDSKLKVDRDSDRV